jgi:hypothetical protein
MFFVGISNDTQIVWNLKHNQSISLWICLYFFINFFNLFDIGCHDCQNKLFSRDHHPCIYYTYLIATSNGSLFLYV